MSFFSVLTEAVQFFERKGFSSEEDLIYWTQRLRESAEASLISEKEMREHLNKHLKVIYSRILKQADELVPHPFNLSKVEPKLRAELDRRIMASANLIRLNREEAISNTLRRFQGWATSIPAGGSKAVEKKDVKDNIRKSLSEMSFVERRVVIDQGHKFNAELRNIIATENGAIACEWHSHWRRPGYNYREDHRERDKQIYLLRDSWAHQQGLVKPGPAGYYDEITSAGEEVYCSCYVTYVYYLHNLPDDMLTKKGKDIVTRGSD